MALLFIITAVLSLTGIMVDSASNITGCDAPLENTTCFQGPCLQPPYMMLFVLTTSCDQCTQLCDSNCDSMKCTASDLCTQMCGTGNCKSMTCDAYRCSQECESATCGVMTCTKNAKNLLLCEQLSKSGQIICESEECNHNCPNGNCTLICSSSVKQCSQTCDGGNCQYRCEAQNFFFLSCKGGSCTNMLPSTTKMPPTTTPTTKMPPTTTAAKV